MDRFVVNNYHQSLSRSFFNCLSRSFLNANNFPVADFVCKHFHVSRLLQLKRVERKKKKIEDEKPTKKSTRVRGKFVGERIYEL